MYRGGVEQKSEAVKALPTWFSMRAGHPYATFGKIDFELALGHIFYKKGDETDPSFGIPSSTFVISPQVSTNYARWGYTAAAWYDYNRRTTWKPWGNLAEYDPNQKSFADFGASLAKSFYLPKFQRLGVEIRRAKLAQPSEDDFHRRSARSIELLEEPNVVLDEDPHVVDAAVEQELAIGRETGEIAAAIGLKRGRERRLFCRRELQFIRVQHRGIVEAPLHRVIEELFAHRAERLSL
jgi:hypothetical protein